MFSQVINHHQVANFSAGTFIFLLDRINATDLSVDNWRQPEAWMMPLIWMVPVALPHTVRLARRLQYQFTRSLQDWPRVVLQTYQHQIGRAYNQATSW